MNERLSPRKRFQGVLHAMRLRGPLAGNPTARMLHAFLSSLTLWHVVWTSILVPLYPMPPARWGALIIQNLLPLGCLVLLRLGFLRPASLFYLAGAVMFATYQVAFNGGIRSPLLGHYVAVPIMASWLLGFQGAIWTLAACLGAALAFALSEMAGIELPRPYTTPLGLWAVLLQITLTGVIPIAQILRKLREESMERQRREQALRESEERFRNMADTAPVMIVLTDATGQVIFLNKTWLDFTGRAIEAELGRGWMAGVHPDDRDECLAKLAASWEAGVRCEMEYRLRRADGEYRSVMCRGVPRFEPDGVLAGYVASLVDITDLKQVLAAQKLESLGILASGIAHDFNNSLGSILAGSELLLSTVDDASPLQNELERIKLIALRSSEVVRQLMVYAGEEGAVLEEIDLTELVREMLQLMKISISKNAALQMDVAEHVPSIRANKAQIRQVVMNLITNASDAVRDSGGTIAVRLESRRAAGGDFVRLEVRDSGCGMSDEIQAKIFDPFFSTKRAGRGMGLAAARGIIQSHGGTIKVESAAGAGACFEILLPCEREGERKSREVLISAPPDGRENITATVLMIDDEDFLRLPIASMLRRKGFTILEAADGAAGLALFQANAADIDIVLLDLTLPGMSGVEILVELRKVRPDIKVVLSTAYGRDRALADVSDPNSVHYLRKPFRVAELTALLRELCLTNQKWGVPMQTSQAASAPGGPGHP